MSDLRLAYRSLRKSPGVTAVVVLTLALGIGANTAIFSMVDQVLFRTLQVPNPGQLVNLSSPGPKTGSVSANSGFGSTAHVFSYALFRDIEQLDAPFAGVAAHRDFMANIAFRGQAWNEPALLVSGSYFPVLGAPPALGRLLSEADDRTPGAHHVAVLNYDYWTNRFDGDPSILNQPIVVNGQPMTIVGVAPRRFVSTTLNHTGKVYVPLTMAALMLPDWNGFADRRDHWLYLFARLRPGAQIGGAERAIDVPFRRLMTELDLPAQRSSLSPAEIDQFARRRLRLEPGAQGQRPDRERQGRVALLLLWLTGSVLVMACANVANMLVARGIHRRGELATKMSLGASRGRLVRSLLTESALLALAGTAAGVLLGAWTVGAVAPVLPGAEGFRFELNTASLMFSLLVASATMVMTGLYPALKSTGSGLATMARETAAPGAGARLGAWLTATQMALSLSLLVLAGLFTQSLLNVGRVELGIRPDHLVTFRISPELSGYSRPRARALVDRLAAELRTLPQVMSVGTSTIPLLDGSGWSSNVTVERADAPALSPSTADVGPGYFRTVGIPLVAGREFTPSDAAGAPKVAVVNESFARAFDLGSDVLGRRFGLGAGNIPIDIEIVGIVRDARYSDVKSPPPAQFYLPYRQAQRFPSINFYVRSTGSAEPLLAAIRQVVARADGTIPIENLRTMDAQVQTNTREDRSLTALAAGFALLALMLSAVGLYGVLSYSVAQRRKEIGVRTALGADSWRIAGLVFGQVARVVGAGAAIGCAAALGLSTLARSMLFGVQGPGAALLVSACGVMALVAGVAAALPARRAVRVDPMTALRAE